MAAFTTIAAATALAATAATTTKSFVQAGKQRKLQEKAEAEADKALADARKRLGVNYAEGIGIQKEAYELEREALIAAGAQALQAGAEGELRGAGATAGRVQMAQQEGQRKIATAMGQEMLGLEKAAAAEDARIAGQLASLDLEEVRGAQLAARDAQEARAAAIQQGVQGIQSLTQQASQFAPLYSKSQAGRAAEAFQGSPEQMRAISDAKLTEQFRGGTTPNIGTYSEGFFDPQLLSQFSLNQPFGGVQLSQKELEEFRRNNPMSITI